MLERLRFADARERVADDGLHQVQQAQGRLTVSLHPVSEILAKLWLEDRLTSWSDGQ